MALARLRASTIVFTEKENLRQVFRWEGNFEMIRRKGTIVMIGNASGLVPDFSPMKLKPKNIHLARPE
jgi:hypothetical protein